MSVLESRALGIVRDYGIACDVLSDEEIAAELVDAVLPFKDDDWTVGTPTWDRLVAELDRCGNCLIAWDDCACCVGCGQADADLIGRHGYHCAL